MRKVKIRSRLVACIGAVFALVLLIGAAVLKMQTHPVSAKDSERQADTNFDLYSWGYVPAGGGYRTSLYKFYRNNQLIFDAYCASGNQDGPGTGQNYSIEVHRVDSETSAEDKYMKYFKIIYYGRTNGYGQAAIHWALSAVNFGWTEQDYPYTVGAYPYKYIFEAWPEELSYGNVYYLNNDNNFTQSIAAAGWEETTITTLKLDKVWLDENSEPESEDVVGQHEAVTVGVYKKLGDDESQDEMVGEVVLSRDNSWKGSIEVEEGYEYYVKEISSTPGYVMDSTCSRTTYTCKIVNTKTEKVRITWIKNWDDEGYEENRPVKIHLLVTRYLNGEKDTTFGNQGERLFYMNESLCRVDDYMWRCRISGLEKNIEIDGQLVDYDYQVEEYINYNDPANDEVKFLYVEDESERSVTVDEETGNITASFTNTLETITVPITKTWDDQGYTELRPWLIVFKIYANGEYYDNAVIWNPDLWDVEEQEAFEWTVDVELPKTDRDGNEISYTFVEDLRSGEGEYEVEVVQNDNTGYHVINRRLAKVTVIKCWVNDDEESRPDEMIFDLWGYTNHPRYHDEIVLTAEDEVAEGENAGCWTKTVTGLPATFGDSPMDYYTVERELDDRYKADQTYCEFSEDNDYTCKFVNGRVVAVQVDKIWQNDDPKDRPGYIEVTLYKDGEQVGESVQLNNDNNWSYTWTDQEYGHDYTVTENIQIPKYKPGAYVYDTDEDGNVFVKIYNAPETLGVKISKYVLTISGVLLGGVFITRRAMARN